ncbi:hypothetical protein OSTOST_08075 [Ostertagia ostertagi]
MDLGGRPSPCATERDFCKVQYCSNRMKSYGYRGHKTATYQAFGLATIFIHKWRHYGARIIYVALRGTQGLNMDNVEQITEDPANIVPVDDVKTLATTAADAVLMKFPPPA